MKTRFSSLSLLLACALMLGGCSHYSKSARQQRAYANYVRNASVTRAKQGLKLRPGKVQLPPMPEASDPIVSSESGPQAMTSGSGSIPN
jgi:PBP1b-binding outer membrane lipoprotein LpoB